MRKQFDLVTHRRDKHGKVKSKSPYRLHVVNGQQRFERDGKFYFPNGEEIPAAPAPKKAEAPKAPEPKKPEPKLEKKQDVPEDAPALADKE